MILYFMIGFPGCGKSTWIANNKKEDSIILSTDQYIQEYADANNTTYNEVFFSQYNNAYNFLYKTLHEIPENTSSVFWDQTNLKRSDRKTKMKKFRSLYPNSKIIGVYFSLEIETCYLRASTRKGKEISKDVYDQLKAPFTIPTKDEGFDELWEISQ